jgi:hypothetical protein
MKPWDSDHTALVHVLWSAQSRGMSLDDPDELASFIRQSDYHEAVQAHAAVAALYNTEIADKCVQRRNSGICSRLGA